MRYAGLKETEGYQHMASRKRFNGGWVALKYVGVWAVVAGFFGCGTTETVTTSWFSGRDTVVTVQYVPADSGEYAHWVPAPWIAERPVPDTVIIREEGKTKWKIKYKDGKVDTVTVTVPVSVPQSVTTETTSSVSLDDQIGLVAVGAGGLLVVLFQIIKYIFRLITSKNTN